MNIDIFQVNKLGSQSYQIIKPTFKSTFKKISNDTETVYVYKNLQFVIDKNGNKLCYQIIPKEVKILNNSFVVHIYELKNLSISSFPLLDKYDDQYERTIDNYEYRNNRFMIIQENNTEQQGNTLYLRVKNDVDLDKFIKEIF